MVARGHSALWSWAKRAAVTAAVVVLLLGGCVGHAWYLERRHDIPADWAVELGFLNPELMPNARETTAQTCVDDLPCRWAVTSDTAVVMMFDDQMDACRAADELPGTARQDWIAVQFTPGALTAQERADLLVHFETYNRNPSSGGIEDVSWLPWVVESCPS